MGVPAAVAHIDPIWLLGGTVIVSVAPPDFRVRQVPAIGGTRKWRRHRLPRWAELVIRPWGGTIGPWQTTRLAALMQARCRPAMSNGRWKVARRNCTSTIWCRRWPPGWAAGLVDRVGLRRGERVLDVACGTWVVAHVAAERVDRGGARRWGSALTPPCWVARGRCRRARGPGSAGCREASLVCLVPMRA